MIKFKTTETGVYIYYHTDRFINNEWLWNSLTIYSNEYQAISNRAFYFKISDIMNPPSDSEDFNDYVYQLKLGKLNGDYFEIPSRILDIDNDLHVYKDITFKRSFFIAERNISIFKKISSLLTHRNPIVIGGEKTNAIPYSIYKELQNNFPTTHQINLYAESRIHNILYQYLDGMKDSSANYDRYLKKKNSNKTYPTSTIPPDLINSEIAKYEYIKNEISDALNKKSNYDEKYWQQLMSQFILLIFPKYIRVLQNVMIKDYYRTPNKNHNRYIDMVLIDANGHIDIIEIKRPFENKILRKSLYRDNHIPELELTGAIMQAEKYLFHLQKWGREGEKLIYKNHKNDIPHNISIQISNPKAIIIMGRDLSLRSNKSTSYNLDFEIIKRKYANIIDIITYDDLLRRLDNTISSLKTI